MTETSAPDEPRVSAAHSANAADPLLQSALERIARAGRTLTGAAAAFVTRNRDGASPVAAVAFDPETPEGAVEAGASLPQMLAALERAGLRTSGCEMLRAPGRAVLGRLWTAHAPGHTLSEDDKACLRMLAGAAERELAAADAPPDPLDAPPSGDGSDRAPAPGASWASRAPEPALAPWLDAGGAFAARLAEAARRGAPPAAALEALGRTLGASYARAPGEAAVWRAPDWAPEPQAEAALTGLLEAVGARLRPGEAFCLRADAAEPAEAAALDGAGAGCVLAAALGLHADAAPSEGPSRFLCLVTPRGAAPPEPAHLDFLRWAAACWAAPGPEADPAPEAALAPDAAGCWSDAIGGHPDAIFIARGPEVLYANAACASVLGAEGAEGFWASLPEGFSAQAQALLDHAAVRDAAETAELPLERPGAPLRALSLHAAPTAFGGGPALLCVARDVTAVKTLAAQAQRQAKIFDSISESVVLTDAEGRITEWNPASEALFGASGGLTLGASINGLFCCEERADPSALFGRILEASGSWRGLLEAPCPGAEARTCETTVVPLRDEARRTTAWVFLNRDVTERKRWETALQESEAFLNTIIDHLPISVFVKDAADLRFIRYNKGAEEILGYAKEEFIGRTDYDFFTREEADFFVQKDREVLASGVLLDIPEEPIHTGHRGLRYLHTRKIPVLDSHGRPRYLLGISEDITERKEAVEAIRESESRYRLLAENATDVITRYSPEGVCLYASPACRALTGLEPAGMVGAPLTDLVHPDDAADVRRRFEQCLLGQSAHFSYRLRRPDGGYGYAESAARGLVDPATGLVTEVISVTRNIDERKQYEVQLVEARERAEEMSRLKSAFLANMSHEIRTPLTAIIGFSDVIAHELPEDCHEFLDMIRRSAHRLMDTLNSVLDLAQLESNTLELQSERLDVAAAIADGMGLFRNTAHEKRLYLRYDRPFEPVYAYADADGFQRVLSNLLSNAMKFTLEGGVHIGIVQSRSHVEIRVRDTGVGMSAEFLPNVFSAFQQESTGLAREYEGSGLGLHLTRQLVLRMGGEITVASEKGAGSTFSLRLPRAEGGHAEEAAPKSRTAHRRQLLAVEDDPNTRTLITHLLSRRYDVELTRTAEEALTAMREKQYDLVLMDIHLGSGLNGEQALRAMRLLQGYQHVPTIAVTAYALPGDRQRFLEAGFDGYLSKPFTRRQLEEAVEQFLPG